MSRIIVTMLTGDVWAVNPLLLTTDGVEGTSFDMEPCFKKGDKVRVKQMEIEEMKQLQEGNGGWSEKISTVS